MLKRYHTVQDIVRDLRRLNRSQKALAAEGDEPPNFTTRTLRQGGDTSRPKTVNERFTEKGKVSREQERSANRHSRRLITLLDQQKSINAIIQALNAEFKEADYPDIKRMRQLASRIGKNISEAIQEAKQSASEEATQTAPDILIKLANNVARKLTDGEKPLFSAEHHETVILARRFKGASEDAPISVQHTVYLKYERVKINRNVTPVYVFAISLKDGELYINPTLPDIKPPGKFPLGEAVQLRQNSKLADLTNAVVGLIQQQLVADGHIMRTHALPPPHPLEKFDLRNANEFVTDAAMDGNILKVSLADTVKNEQQAHDVANDIYRHLYHVSLPVSPKLNIKYTVRPGSKRGWVVSFVFMPSDKYSGRTMDNRMVSELRKLGMFPSEIQKIRHIIET